METEIPPDDGQSLERQRPRLKTIWIETILVEMTEAVRPSLEDRDEANKTQEEAARHKTARCQDGVFSNFALKFSISGHETGEIKVRSGGSDPPCTALSRNSSASPAVGGTTAVAAKIPLRTHAWPVSGRPSQPVNGKASHTPSLCAGRGSQVLGLRNWRFLGPVIFLRLRTSDRRS